MWVIIFPCCLILHFSSLVDWRRQKGRNKSNNKVNKVKSGMFQILNINLYCSFAQCASGGRTTNSKFACILSKTSLSNGWKDFHFAYCATVECGLGELVQETNCTAHKESGIHSSFWFFFPLKGASWGVLAFKSGTPSYFVDFVFWEPLWKLFRMSQEDPHTPQLAKIIWNEELVVYFKL